MPPPLDRFRLVHRYREGTWRGRYTGQFARSVYVVDCTMDEIPLRGKGDEGIIPCWARIEDAVSWLDNPVLTRILTRILSGEPIEIGDFSRHRAADRMDRSGART